MRASADFLISSIYASVCGESGVAGRLRNVMVLVSDALGAGLSL